MAKLSPFQQKLILLCVVALSAAVSLAESAYKAGQPALAIACTIGITALTAVSYALDPNHVTPTKAQVVSAIDGDWSTVEQSIPQVKQVESIPVVGSEVKSIVDGAVDAGAKTLATDLGAK